MYSYHSAHGCISTVVNMDVAVQECTWVWVCWFSKAHVLIMEHACTTSALHIHDTLAQNHRHIYQYISMPGFMVLDSVHWTHTQECILCFIKTCSFFQNSYICLLSFVLGILRYFLLLPYTPCQILSSRKSLSEPKFLVFCCFDPLHLILVAYMSMAWVIYWILVSYQRLHR